MCSVSVCYCTSLCIYFTLISYFCMSSITSVYFTSSPRIFCCTPCLCSCSICYCTSFCIWCTSISFFVEVCITCIYCTSSICSVWLQSLCSVSVCYCTVLCVYFTFISYFCMSSCTAVVYCYSYFSYWGIWINYFYCSRIFSRCSIFPSVYSCRW